jgi:hypothetical protein
MKMLDCRNMACLEPVVIKVGEVANMYDTFNSFLSAQKVVRI